MRRGWMTAGLVLLAGLYAAADVTVKTKITQESPFVGLGGPEENETLYLKEGKSCTMRKEEGVSIVVRLRERNIWLINWKQGWYYDMPFQQGGAGEAVEKQERQKKYEAQIARLEKDIAEIEKELKRSKLKRGEREDLEAQLLRKQDQLKIAKGLLKQDEPILSVQPSGKPNRKILDYECRHFEVRENGNLVEEIWATVGLEKSYDEYARLTRELQEALASDSGIRRRESQILKELGGIPLWRKKRKGSFGEAPEGGADLTEYEVRAVTQISFQEVSEQKFLLPKKLKKLKK